MTSPGSNDVEIRVIVRDLASTALRGVASTARGLSTAAGSALGPITGLGKAMGALGAAAGAGQAVAGLGAALAAAAPAALVLPGALLAGAAAGATMKLAFSGMSDAIAAEDAAAFAEATKDMAPAAVEAASAVRSLKPAFDDVRRSVQQAFFSGLGPEIERLGGEYMPLLETGLTGISMQLNLVGRGLVEAFSSRDVQSDFAGLLEETRESLTGIGPAAGDAAAGVLKLGLFGTQQMNGLGEAISGVASRFRGWASEGVESGSFQAAFDEALLVLEQFGAVASNVGRIVRSVFTGLFSAEEGLPFLERLREITGALADMLATAEAQEGLRALGDILTTIGQVVGEVVVAAFRDLGPPIGRFLQEHGPALQEVFRFIGDVLVNVVIPAIAAFIDWLTYTAIPGVTQFVLVVTSGWAQMAVTAADAVNGILFVFGGMFRALSFLPGPFGAAFGAAADSIDGARDSVTGFRDEMAALRDRTVRLTLESQAEQRADSIRRAIANIPSMKNVTIRVTEQWGATARRAGMPGFITERATGGPVRGPGTGTSDTAGLFALSNGEHIWTAAEVAAVGGHAGVEALRKAALSGRAAPAPAGAPAAGGGGSGGVTRVELVAGPGASGAFADLIMQMVRTGELQLQVAG